MSIKSWLTDQSVLQLKKAWGADFPNKADTISYLEDYLVAPGENRSIRLPEISDAVDSNKIIFVGKTVHDSRNFVWDYKPSDKNSYQLKIGSIVTDNKVLETDFGYLRLLTPDFGGRKVFQDFFVPDRRKNIHVETLIAPWGQYFRKEYYLYVAMIVAKLCRIKDIIGEEKFENAFVSYPLFGTSFEKEYLELLGFKPDQVLNSRHKKISFENCILGNNEDWTYQNAESIFSLRRHLGPKLQLTNELATGNKRIYICRSGRRRVLNEAALIKLLEKLDFEIYPDQPRSVAEQYAMYHNASFIMGPHGSSFSNIVWCKPGTHLFELFPSTFVFDYFLYISELLGLTYSAYCVGPLVPNYKYKTINDNVQISIPDIEKYLREYFDRADATVRD